jgi:Domain of unknown function (DUF4145)
MTIAFNKDKDLGSIHRVACLRCARRTDHAVVSAYQVRGDEESGDWSYSWEENYQIIQCLGCKSISFRLAKSNSEDFADDEHGKRFHPEDESLYPARVEGLQHFDGDLVYLPNQLRRIYEETTRALANQQPVLAGIGLRALVESLCKDNKAKGNNLANKIDDLVQLQILTPNDAHILHSIRTLGNDSAHEAKPHNEMQLQLAITVAENLLRSVYILPAKANAAFSQ